MFTARPTSTDRTASEMLACTITSSFDHRLRIGTSVGENAVLVPPGDPEALARGFRTILQDAAASRALGDRARRDAAQYTWHRRAERALTAALGRP